ncbi:EscU/YscU/HrcU family type III secretion system export apparatus switch protein [Radiobacillus kanasensis]|uniref:EscU/YscU/HrcU family type III secretion system export apparatus switch protein n=1 Tax=Radiobacillus kanasensis TaxID=2844358 RepID=UPI001E3FAB57|nr:EscU/YscU/HrcU family type III secretion system export apparatus switch protein [Radiobacillus kanasensis]UFU01012.1 EscU/YscU/HrcU family type III secretion system export apparatus switch protein [Radiobacillus kanasensis]
MKSTGEQKEFSKAAALRYDKDKETSPKVTALGKGYVADNIIEKAKEHNIPIQEDSTLVELLSKLSINESIPEDLYQAVAEVFALVYRVDKKIGDSSSSLFEKNPSQKRNLDVR